MKGNTPIEYLQDFQLTESPIDNSEYLLEISIRVL